MGTEMKLTTNDGETYIAQRERFYKYTICFSVFIGAYALWCFVWLMITIAKIVFGGELVSVFYGCGYVLGLFLSAMWFDEVLNDV